jgi:RimJ/RimL family protein N-acetyltransferase
MTLEVRRPEPGDEARYFELFSDVGVGRTLWPGEMGGPRTREEAAEIAANDFAHWEQHGFGPWLTFDGETFAGHGGLKSTDVGGPGVEVLYSLRSELWGRGLAKAVALRAVTFARELELPEVVGFAWTENPASIHVLESAGLRFEHVIQHAGLPHWFGRLAL